MIGPSHARTGVCAVAVMGTVGLLPWHEPRAVLLCAGLVVGGSIAPDLDHGTAGPAKSFGILTRVASANVQVLSKVALSLTSTPRDGHRKGAHRTLTHSALGCVLFGVGLAVLALLSDPAHPVPLAIGVGVLTGMGVYALAGKVRTKREKVAWWPVRKNEKRRRRRKPTALDRLIAKWWPKRNTWKWLSVLAAMVIVLTTPEITTGWWPWWLGASLTLGMIVHCAGDAMTDVGVPWTWPLLREGRRWGHRWLVPEPLRFTTEHTGEQVALVLITTGTVGFCVAVLTAPSWWPWS